MKRDVSNSSDARQKPLVVTKLRPPSNRGALIERPKLIEILRQTLHRKLALIHGPAGFGKTTLATQWLEELRDAGISTAWLAIDSSDNDLNRLLSYLAAAISNTEPGLGEGLQEVIEANPGNATDFVIDTLCSDLSLHGDSFVLFLDDWHLVRDTAVHDALQKLLSRCPPNFHVAVTSRTRAGLPLARLRVQNELVEIDATRLRFDYEESETYLNHARALSLHADDVQALWKNTEGWAAALQLASMSLRESGGQERIRQWTSGAANDISEYLAENVVNSLAPDQIAFLLKTSVLERMSGDLCIAVTGEPDSAARLESLERQEMFLLPLDEERQWYRYHHLFARFLQQRLKKQMPEQIASLHRAASSWFEANGQTAEAMEHALLAGEQSLAIDLVERDAMALVEHSYMSTLLNLVSKLPRTTLFDRPTLQMAIAWANCLTHRPQEAHEALWHVERAAAAEKASQKALLLGEANVVRACVSIYCDQIEGPEELVQPCMDRAAKYSPWVVGVSANILAYRYIHIFEFDKVSPLLRWGRDYQDRARGLFSAVYGRCFEGVAAMRSGDIEGAKRMFAEAMDVAASTAGKQSNAARLASALMGQLLYEANDLPTAERLLRESRFLGVEGGVVDFYLATYLSTSRLMMQKGDTDGALAILKEGEETSKALLLERLGVAVICERVRVKLGMGDIRGAEQVLSELDTHREAISRGGVPQDSIENLSYIAMAKARLLLARGITGTAIRLLKEQVQITRSKGWKQQEWSLRILMALALDRDHRPDEATTCLIETINEAAPRGVIRAFLDEGNAVLGILERAHRQSGDGAPLNSLPQGLLSIGRHAQHGIPGRQGVCGRLADLTARETEVLRLLDQGQSNKEVARNLSISVDTVKWYLKNIFIKLGVSTRLQAINELRRISQLGPSP